MKTIRFSPTIELVFREKADIKNRWQCLWEIEINGKIATGVSTHALRNGALERGLKALSIRLSAHGDEEAKKDQAEKRATQ